MTAITTRTSFAVAGVIAAALAVSACGSDDSSSSTSTAASSGITATKDATIAASVPSKYSTAGTLSVATDASYAPMEYVEDGSTDIIGADVDLANALGQVMGLKADVQNAGFDAIIPGLASGKYDIGMSSFTDTKEREATVDFVTYFEAGTSFFGKKGGPAPNDLAALCGLTVAVEKGTIQADDANAQADKCAADKKLTVLVFPDQNGANSAVISGRAEVSMADSPVAAYQVTQSDGRLVLVGTPYGTAPYGIAIPKNSGLSGPILAAMENLIAGGQYTAILKKWGLEEGAITNPVINGAIN